MCKLIADLVGADKDIVQEVVHRFERVSGFPGVDVRLTGEIYGSTHLKMRELGLDPHDTTPEELYQGLLGLADLHDSFIARRFGIQDRTNTEQVLSTVASVVQKLRIPRQTWAIKGIAIKRILKAVPPKQLMRALHYRSLDSMVKREPATLLLTMARYVESEKWQHQFLDAYTRLAPNDFEQRDIRVAYLDELKWSAVVQDIASAHHTNTFFSIESGAIFLTPLPRRGSRGLTLATFMIVLHAVNDIRMHATYLKFHQLLPGFGERLRRVASRVPLNDVRIAGQSIQWRVVHRYYGTTTRVLHPEVFEPHIQAEDLSYRKAEQVLYRLEPALRFWCNLDYIGLDTSGDPVSFNLMDVTLGLLNAVPYAERLTYHLRDALWNELLVRYVGQRPLERQLLQHLHSRTIDQTTILPEMEFAT